MMGPGLATLLHAQRWFSALHAHPSSTLTTTTTPHNSKHHGHHNAQARSWTDRLTSLYNSSGNGDASDDSSDSDVDPFARQTPPASSRQTPLNQTTSTQQQQQQQQRRKQQQLEALEEALLEQGDSQDGSSDDGDHLGLVGSGGLATMLHRAAGLTATEGENATAAARRRRSHSSFSPAPGRGAAQNGVNAGSTSGSDYEVDVEVVLGSRPGAARSGGSGGGAQRTQRGPGVAAGAGAATGLLARERRAQQAAEEGEQRGVPWGPVVEPRPAGPSRLLAVTHGAACVRGRQKTDMQDHHLMVQDIMELAAHASSSSSSPSAQQRGAFSQQRKGAAPSELVIEEWDDHGGELVPLTAFAAPASQHAQHATLGGLQLRQSLRRHATYTAPAPHADGNGNGSGARRVSWMRQMNGGGAGEDAEQGDEEQGGVGVCCSSSLTGVFDGHCGSRSSRYAARRLPVLLAHSPQLWAALDGASRPQGLDGHSLSLAAGALHEAYAKLDREILEEDRHKPPGEFDGTTALLGLQVGSHLILANLGDSRAVLCRAGEAVRLTTDHTPDLLDERKRIEACGGFVREHRGVWRVVLPLGPGCGLKISAVSRALGDVDFKEPRPLISAVPDVFHCALQPHADRFAVFASDGVWGVVTDQQAVDCVSAALAQAARAGLPRQQCAEQAAQALRTLAQESGSGDDITAVVTLFEWEPPAPSAEEQEVGVEACELC